MSATGLIEQEKDLVGALSRVCAGLRGEGFEVRWEGDEEREKEREMRKRKREEEWVQEESKRAEGREERERERLREEENEDRLPDELPPLPDVDGDDAEVPSIQVDEHPTAYGVEEGDVSMVDATDLPPLPTADTSAVPTPNRSVEPESDVPGEVEISKPEEPILMGDSKADIMPLTEETNEGKDTNSLLLESSLYPSLPPLPTSIDTPDHEQPENAQRTDQTDSAAPLVEIDTGTTAAEALAIADAADAADSAQRRRSGRVAQRVTRGRESSTDSEEELLAQSGGANGASGSGVAGDYDGAGGYGSSATGGDRRWVVGEGQEEELSEYAKRLIDPEVYVRSLFVSEGNVEMPVMGQNGAFINELLSPNEQEVLVHDCLTDLHRFLADSLEYRARLAEIRDGVLGVERRRKGMWRVVREVAQDWLEEEQAAMDTTEV